MNLIYDHDFRKAGFLDSGKGYGASPDGLDDDARLGCEIKCPMAHTHVSYLLKNRLPSKYFQQVQGAMLVTGFKEWVFFSYHPKLDPLYVKVERDDEYINAMSDLLASNCRLVENGFKKLRITNE